MAKADTQRNRLDTGHGRIQHGMAAGAAMSAISDELDAQTRTVTKAVFAIIKAGKPLDPQLAIQSWVELFEIDKLKQRLTRTEKRGQAMAKRLGGDMAIDNGGDVGSE